MTILLDIKLKCPHCNFQEDDTEKFIDTTSSCSDCGEHSAIECPHCRTVFDHIYDSEVCTECGRILNAHEDCPDHSDAKIISWRFDLNRGA